MMAPKELPAQSRKAWLRSRRPEQFSDSATNEVLEIDRSLLEYHLDSLTSRSQEVDFQEFARRLCSYEICPNLLPQTGPTGGGDSKVDSETYPVAERLALRWYVGSGNESGSERWAFAFSAKARWRDKVRSDITKLVGTGRAYAKAFFVSNQAIPDRKRAEVEDQLSKEHGIDVRILDRTWILDRVFTNSRQNIAIEELHLTGLTLRQRSIGPNDANREDRRARAEKQLEDSLQQGPPNFAMVDLALEIAIFAREIERPAAELASLFARADLWALDYGTGRQQVESAYERARTDIWWLEDVAAFAKSYQIVEQRTAGSLNVHDLQQRTNLWMILHGEVQRGTLDATDYAERTEALQTELRRLQLDKNRPSAALQAEAMLAFMGLFQAIDSRDAVDEIVGSLRDIVLRSERLPGFPFRQFVGPLEDLGSLLERVPNYNSLFETIVDVTAKRSGEVAAARLLLKRGESQLYSNSPVDAISTLGRALARLQKHETRNAASKALYLCGHAYERLGLSWAARGTLLAAASVATAEYWVYGEVTNSQARCYHRLKWLELRLGRIPQALCWHEVEEAVRGQLSAQEATDEVSDERQVQFDMALGTLFLKVDRLGLESLIQLPETLDGLDLPFAATALLYALGYEERMAEIAGPSEQTSDAWATRWRDLLWESALPPAPALYDKARVSLTSHVLGCRVTVDCENASPCIEVAESILAALESFLATSVPKRAMALQSDLAIKVDISDLVGEFLTAEVEELHGLSRVGVRCQRFDPHSVPAKDQARLQDVVFDAVVKILANMVAFKNIDSDLEELFRNERVAERASGFTGSFVTLSNVLGKTPKTTINDWSSSGARRFPLARPEPWDARTVAGSQADRRLTAGHHGASQLSIDIRNVPHNEIGTSSLIRVRLWERAEWRGAMFEADRTLTLDPILRLVFLDPTAAREIFEHWREELGDNDTAQALRIAAVRGIDRNHPYAYRIMISPSPHSVFRSATVGQFISRVHRLDATTPENLERFIYAYRAKGRFTLAPAFMEGNEPRTIDGLGITLHRLHVRHAWEIGKNDIDAGAIVDGEEPIIPDHAVDSAPVIALLGRLRSPG